ncbi:hypothetical protein [Alkaliphilus transvaalensis]|uniref:hypothetical protein n=1 Tax=Alkaliphilus transvaalensis TaxID=114628 RepID=UPI000687DF60|nr:hypothetical protein [Alkaliphilus transvaalensis]
MLNSIQDRRVKTDDGYDLYLEVPDQEYLQIYEDVNEEGAQNILNLYLEYYSDDGRPQGIKVNHDEKNHTVNIHTRLSYEGNTHTEAYIRPNPIRHYSSQRQQ